MQGDLKCLFWRFQAESDEKSSCHKRNLAMCLNSIKKFNFSKEWRGREIQIINHETYNTET